MILLCYDGSADAQAAIDRAAQSMPGAQATVLTIWAPFLVTINHAGALGLAASGVYVDNRQVDLNRRRAAHEHATEGAQRATAAGLHAEPRIAGQDGGSARTILAVAAEIDADIIVLGTRGLGGVKSFLLGSVSHDVVQHADRAVMVVPSFAIATRRRDSSHHAGISEVLL